MIGMKKPPIAASVSIRPVAEPMCSARMLLTLEGTANQAAKPKMRKKPMPIPRGQSKMLGTTGMRASKAATATSGPTTNIRRFVLRSAKCPQHAARDAGHEDEGGQQPARRRVEVPICCYVLAEQLRCGEVGAVSAEKRDAVDPQIPGHERGPQCGAVELHTTERVAAFREPKGRSGDHGDQQFEHSAQDHRDVPAHRSLDVQPAVEGERGSRAEGGSAGHAECKGDLLLAEPDDH
jgi:hypothetical protein